MTFKNTLVKMRWAFLACALFFLCFGLMLSSFDQAKAEKNPTPEEVAERAILAYGGRAALYAIQRNGTLRALIKFISPEETREGKSITRFIRKEKLNDDLRMIELDFPGTKYLIGFDGKETWSILDGEIQKPREAAVTAFKAAHAHSYESLLRYKENNAKLEYVSNTKLGNLEMDIIDLVSAEGVRTRYEVSRKSGRILYLNYEDNQEEQAEPTKYRLYFKDFHVIQNTLVPYVTMVYQNGKLIEERKIVEAIFNVQLEEKSFLAENANKLADTASKQ